VDNQKLTQPISSPLQESSTQAGEVELSRCDRRLLLGSSLRLLRHRFVCGKPILRDDVLRVASLADDARERAA
jgi:hypothetical protein